MEVFSFDDLKKVTGKSYDTVEAYGGLVTIGSLSSADMIEWLESNDDPTKKREAGLRLIVKSIVNGEHEHLPEEQHDEFLQHFRIKDARENGKVVKRILELNGLNKVRAASLLKNDSSEAPSDASRSDSPSPAGA